jgi:tetratricopeptide (TPR) repeat protein
MIGAIILFFILGRYRQPLVPITALFAGAGVIDLFRRIRLKQCQRVRVAALATFASLLICNLPIHDESMLRASSYMNMGIAAGQAGNLDVSIPALQKAIKKHPEMVEAYVNLGHAMEMSNRSDNAIACYEAALKIDPDLIMVDAALGLAYAKRGNLQQAIFHYERAIQIDPQDEQSRVALNTLLTMPKP